MKKNIFLTTLILSLISTPVFAEDLLPDFSDVENSKINFYQSPQIEVVAGPEPSVVNVTQPIKGMPLFKKIRIKTTNFIREKDYNNTLKQIEKQRLLQEKAEAEKNAKIQKEININLTPQNSPSEETLELAGGVKEQVVSKDAQLDADNIDYDNKTMELVATGSPILYFPPQNTTIKAKKFVYNQASNVLKAYEDVEVIKEGNHVFGDFLQINMNEENAFLDNMKTKNSFLTVYARKSQMDENTITLYNGKIVSEDSYILKFQTEMINGTNINNIFVNPNEKSALSDITGETAIHIKAKDVIVNAKNDHDTFTLKKAQINYGDVDLFRIPSMTFHTNKNHDYFEANYPEFGSRSNFGMYIGPGFVFDTPLQKGSTLKLIPVVSNKDGVGIGGLVKYRSATNFTDFGYSTSMGKFILRGRQELDDKLRLQYGINSFMDEWFMGQRMAKYNAELIYEDTSVAQSTIGKGLNLTFRQRLGFGYMQDGDYNVHDEHFVSSDVATVRGRYMASASQSLFNYYDPKKLRFLNLSLTMQGSAAIYGTGDTQFIGRIGPNLHTQYKYWLQDIGFFASAYQDGTPMPVYDTYRFGHGNIYIREALRLCKYLTIGWSGSITVTGDSPNGQMFQENSFLVSIGPDDFKFNIGYDWIREQTYFSFILAMDTKGSSLEYDKMIIKNHDKLAKKDDKLELKVFGETKKEVTKPQKMQYAEVIEIEDPDREQL